MADPGQALVPRDRVARALARRARAALRPRVQAGVRRPDRALSPVPGVRAPPVDLPHHRGHPIGFLGDGRRRCGAQGPLPLRAAPADHRRQPGFHPGDQPAGVRRVPRGDRRAAVVHAPTRRVPRGHHRPAGRSDLPPRLADRRVQRAICASSSGTCSPSGSSSSRSSTARDGPVVPPVVPTDRSGGVRRRPAARRALRGIASIAAMVLSLAGSTAVFALALAFFRRRSRLFGALL